MKKFLILIILSFFYLGGFKLSKHLTELNPVEYVYSFPITDVRQAIYDKFSNGRNSIFLYWPGNSLQNLDTNENPKYKGKNYVQLSQITSRPRSSIYYNWWGKLRFICSRYYLTIDSITENKTKVSIISYHQVRTGWKIGITHGGIPWIEETFDEVEASTLEEYEILLTIGEALGEKDMPLIKRPKFCK